MGRLKTGLKFGGSMLPGVGPAVDKLTGNKTMEPWETIVHGLKHPEAVKTVKTVFVQCLPRLLESEEVQEELVPFIGEVLQAALGQQGEQPAAVRAPGEVEPARTVNAPPKDQWPYSILYLPTLMQRIEESEGKDLTYHDVFGEVHVGIGHCTKDDGIPDHLQQIGMTITEEQCAEFFEEDLAEARSRLRRGARKQQCDLDTLPVPVREGLLNMFFQLGYKPAYWNNMWTYIKAGNYPEAARESLRSGAVAGKPSGWWLQTRNRAAVVAPMLSNKTLWFEVGDETVFDDGSRGHDVIEHQWQH